MKLLVVLPSPPLPEGGAPGRCAVALLRGLAHAVEDQALAVRQYCDDEPSSHLPVELVDVDPLRRGWSTLPGRARRPRGRLGRGALARPVRQLASEVDIMHLEETETAWCDEGLQTPCLVHLHYRTRRDRSFGTPSSLHDARSYDRNVDRLQGHAPHASAPEWLTFRFPEIWLRDSGLGISWNAWNA